MDINLCMEILNQRSNTQCECNSINHVNCSFNRLNLNQRESNDDSNMPGETATINTDFQNEISIINEMTNYGLLKAMMSLQCTRVNEYTAFNRAMRLLVDNNKLSEYPTLVCEITSRFAAISSNIIKIKVILLLFRNVPIILLLICTIKYRTNSLSVTCIQL